MPNERQLLESLRERRQQLDADQFNIEIMLIGWLTYWKYDEVFADEERGVTVPDADIVGKNFSENTIEHRRKDVLKFFSDRSNINDALTESIIKKTLEEHVKKYPKQKHLVPIMQGIASSFLYSVLLVLAVWIATYKYDLADLAKIFAQQTSLGAQQTNPGSISAPTIPGG